MLKCHCNAPKLAFKISKHANDAVGDSICLDSYLLKTNKPYQDVSTCVSCDMASRPDLRPRAEVV